MNSPPFKFLRMCNPLIVESKSNHSPVKTCKSPGTLLSGVDLPAAGVSNINMGRSPFYKSPATKLRNQRRLSAYLKGKISKSMIPAKLLKPITLSKSTVSQTSYPEPCIVCKKHQCEWDMLHVITYPVLDSINSAFDSVMERPFFKSCETLPD